MPTRLKGIWDNALFSVLLAAATGLLAWLSLHYDYRLDWSPEHLRGLSPASQDLLARMDGSLQVTAYVQPDSNTATRMRRLVKRYQAFKPDLHLREINPLAAPDQVREHGIQINGELIVRYQDRSQHVRPHSKTRDGPLDQYSERDFSTALQQLIARRGLKLRFLSGHGERNPSGKANHDLGDWGRLLEGRGYISEPYYSGEKLPASDGEEILVLTVPRIALRDEELEELRQYLDQGGNLLWLAEPGEQYGLEQIATWLSIRLLPGILLDGSLGDPTLVSVPPVSYQRHPLLSGLQLTSLFAEATAIEIEQPSDGWEAQALILSTERTWLETGTLLGTVQYDPETERKGPLNLAVVLERVLEETGRSSGHDPAAGADQEAGKSTTGQAGGSDRQDTTGHAEAFISAGEQQAAPRRQRVVVAGDGDFLSNTYLQNGGNIELGLRMVDWLSTNTGLLSIPQIEPKDTRLDLSLEALNLYSVFFVFLLPAALVFAGWRLRRYRQLKR